MTMADMPRQSSFLAGLSIVTIMLYVASSPFYIVGSLTLGDVWMMVAVAGVLSFNRAREAVIRLLRGSYGAISLTITVSLFVAALNAHDIFGALTFVAQFLFTLWIVIPIVAAGIAEHRDPFSFLRNCGWAYLTFYALGLALLFGFGSEAMLVQTGIGRVGPQFTLQVFQFGIMAAGVAGILFSTHSRYSYATLLTLSLIPVLLNASRTGLASFALLGLLALFATIRSPRRLLILVISVVLLVGLGFLIMSSSGLEDMWGLRVLDPGKFFEDQERIASLNASLTAVGQSTRTLLFGAGWGSSGEGIVVHNFVIQVVHEGGVFVLLAICALFILPVIWTFGARNGDLMTKQFVLMLTGVFVLFWSLNSLSVERPYWLTYAVALGFAHRFRLRQASRVELDLIGLGRTSASS